MIVAQSTDRRFIGLPVAGEVKRGGAISVGGVTIRLQFALALPGGGLITGNPNYILHLEN